MCLKVTEKSKKRKATKDIVCYKIVKLVDDVILTPYWDAEVVIGNTYTSDIVHDEIHNLVYQALHSFATINGAKLERQWQNNFHYFTAIVKCTIPKGARYIKGLYDTTISNGEYKSNMVEAYASDTITYNEILK